MTASYLSSLPLVTLYLEKAGSLSALTPIPVLPRSHTPPRYPPTPPCYTYLPTVVTVTAGCRGYYLPLAALPTRRLR